MILRLSWMTALTLLVLSLALLAGCGGDDDDDSSGDDTGDDDTDDDSDDDADDDMDDDTGDDDTDLSNGWQWVAVDGAVCRDGSSTGFMVRHSETSDKLMVFLQGGGACYSESSCADNPSTFGVSEAETKAGSLNVGIFDNTNNANPVKDWNVIFVPYCTGDVYAGSNPDGVVGGVGPQKYMGYQNMKLIAPEAATRFPGMSRVLLSGESAGGFGTMFNYKNFATAFDGVRVDMFDDSGPLPASDDVLAPCYVTLLTIQFGGDVAENEICPDCIQANGDGLSDFAVYYAENWPGSAFGLYSTLEDATIRDFFGLGQDSCSGTEPIPADDFAAGLRDLRDNTLQDTGRWGTFFTDGDAHTCTMENATFYTDETAGSTVAVWLTDLLNDTITDVDPAL